MWEFIGQFPDRFQAFNYAMQAQSSAVSWSTALYPFHEILSQLGSTQETPLVIDIGGGKGHTLNQIKQLTGPVPGRFILQERQEVLDDIDEELPGIERQAHDFFTPQPVKGMYFLQFSFMSLVYVTLRSVILTNHFGMTKVPSFITFVESFMTGQMRLV